MRTAVDIPDPLYRRFKSAAALRGCSVKELVLRGVQTELKGGRSVSRKKAVRLPIIESKNPGWLELTNQAGEDALLLN